MRKVRIVRMELVRRREEGREGGRAGERAATVGGGGEGEESLGRGGAEDEEEDGEEAVCFAFSVYVWFGREGGRGGCGVRAGWLL